MTQKDIKEAMLSHLDEEIDHMLDALFRDNPRWFAWEQGCCSALSYTLYTHFGTDRMFVVNEVKKRLPVFSKRYHQEITFKDYQEYSVKWVLDYVN